MYRPKGLFPIIFDDFLDKIMSIDGQFRFLSW